MTATSLTPGHNCDSGKVYVSKHFLILLSDLEVKKIHHRAYAHLVQG